MESVMETVETLETTSLTFLSPIDVTIPPNSSARIDTRFRIFDADPNARLLICSPVPHLHVELKLFTNADCPFPVVINVTNPSPSPLRIETCQEIAHLKILREFDGIRVQNTRGAVSVDESGGMEWDDPIVEAPESPSLIQYL